LRLRLDNAGQAVTGWVDLMLSGGVAVVDAGDAEPQANGSLRWVYELAENDSLERLVWTRLPLSETGTAMAEARIHADGSPNDPYATLTLALPTTGTPALAEALNRLDSLVQTNPAYRTARQSAQRAATALAQGKLSNARSELLKTADVLLKLAAPEAADLRQAIDEALRRLSLSG